MNSNTSITKLRRSLKRHGDTAAFEEAALADADSMLKLSRQEALKTLQAVALIEEELDQIDPLAQETDAEHYKALQKKFAKAQAEARLKSQAFTRAFARRRHIKARLAIASSIFKRTLALVEQAEEKQSNLGTAKRRS